MRNKKHKSGPSKRQKSLAASHLVNNSAILALEARSSSKEGPPLMSSRSTQHICSSSHGSEPQHHDDSPSIKHVFVTDWLEDEDADLDDEALETDSVEEEYTGGSKFFTSPVNATPLFPIASALVAFPPTVLSPASPQAAAPSAPKDTTLPSTPASFPTTQPNPLVPTVSAAHHNSDFESSSWRNILANNRNITSCPKLSHYSAFTETNGCDLVGDDLDVKCDFWRLCLIGYVAGRSPGFKALQNVIANSWKCEASCLTAFCDRLVLTRKCMSVRCSN
ncbi:hypothetical protein NC651_015356 [Populus alba x Populus x berolinensis]|nr:hypothetical protein NC651_015356 [Populus alba x Populus x berolinensis]